MFHIIINAQLFTGDIKAQISSWAAVGLTLPPSLLQSAGPQYLLLLFSLLIV